MPLGDGYLSLMLLLVFDAFSVVRLEHLVAGDWECVSRFLALSFRGRGSNNLLDVELVFLLGLVQLFLVNLFGRLLFCGRYSLFSWLHLCFWVAFDFMFLVCKCWKGSCIMACKNAFYYGLECLH